MKHNNNDVGNNNNEKTFTGKSNCQNPKKQLLFIILSYKGQQCEKVIKSFKTALHNLYQITQKLKLCLPERNWVLICKLKTKESSTINMI